GLSKEIQLDQDFNCQAHRKKCGTVTKRHLFEHLPQVLFIHARLAQSHGLDKDRRVIQERISQYCVPMEIDFKNLCAQSLQLDPDYSDDYFKYELCGFMAHRGSTAIGHWVSCLRHGKQWFLYDDSNISEIDEKIIAAMADIGQFKPGGV